MKLQREKLEQSISLLQEDNIDLWLTIARESKMNPDPILPLILVPHMGQTAMIAVNQKGSISVMSGNLDLPGFKEYGGFDEYIQYDNDFDSAFISFLQRENPKKIALNYSLEDVSSDGLSHGLFLRVKEIDQSGFTGEIVSSENILKTLRGVKTPEQIEKIKKAIDVTEEIFNEAKDYIQVGRTERDIHLFFRQRMVDKGESLSNQELGAPAVFAGKDTLFSHKGPADIELKAGETITVDCGMRYQGYCSDMQRCYYILKEGETKVPDEVQHAYDAISEAITRGMNAMKPGAIAADIDQIAREYYLSQGLPDFNFALGHQVGTFIHDGGLTLGPRRGRYLGRVEGPLMENMVFTLEIATKTSYGVVGQEEIVVVKEDGVEVLSQRQREIFLLK